MADNKRTLMELHLHSHGDLQFGPRSLGSATGERTEPTGEQTAGETGGGGLSVGLLALVVLGAAAGAAVLRRRAERREPVEVEQKNLDRWIPTR